MKRIKFFMVFFLLLWCGINGAAQNSQEYIYQDSAVLYPADEKKEEAVAAPDTEVTDEQETEEESVDTNLYYNQLTISADSVRALKNEKGLVYAKNLDSLLKQLQKNKNTSLNSGAAEDSAFGNFLASRATSVFLWTVAVVFLLFILYKLFFAEGFFQRQSARVTVAVVKETETGDIMSGDEYGKLAMDAAKNRQFRLATRYLYLELLQKLSRSGAIHFAPDKTNGQYSRELQGKSYREQFDQLTSHYEYVWYGGFAIDEALFYKVQGVFKKLNQQL
jgi:hypothetical protein